jgi:small-conductance mechanosensitive channel
MNWNSLYAWIYAPILTMGDTDITIARIGGVVLMLLFVWWLSSILETTLRRIALRGHHAHTTSSTVYAFTRLVRYVVWIVGTIMGLNIMGFDLTSLAFLGGAIGLGIGFGLQNIFSNFISGIIILIEKTLKIGDFVDLQSGVRGTVVEIGMRYTRVTTNDAVDVLVPNSEFINHPVTNWTYGDRTRVMRVPFGVAYGSDKNEVREAALAAAHSVKGVIIDEQHPVSVLLKRFGDSSLDFEIGVWVGTELVTKPGGTVSRVLWALEDELTKRGIEIPNPQRDLNIRSGTLPVRIQDADGNATQPAGSAQTLAAARS